MAQIQRQDEEIQLSVRESQPVQQNCTGRKIDIKEIQDVFKKKNFCRGFSIFDENKDEKIDVHELKEMIRKMGNEIPSDITRKILALSDTKNDGYLDFPEFVKMVTNPDFKTLFGRYINAYVNKVVPKRSHKGQKRFSLTSVFVRFIKVVSRTIKIEELDDSFAEEYSCWPPPVAMVITSVIIIIFFAIDAIFYDSTQGAGPMADALMYDPQRRYEAWRYVSYMFVHIGHTHLIFNLSVQIMLGIPLEMVHRGWRVLIIFTAGVLAGSLGTSVTDPYVRLAGASGGVYSLITAHIASVIINWNEMTLPFIQLFLLLIITGVDLGMTIYDQYYQKVQDHIGYEAHFAGALAGLLVGIFVLRNLEPSTCENRLWWSALFVFSAFICFAVIWNVVYTDYYPPQI